MRVLSLPGACLRRLRTIERPLLRYALAVALFFLALALRFLAFPVESGLPFLTFYPAMVIAFYLFGIGPGAVCGALGALAGYYAFTPPYMSFAPNHDSTLAAAIFLFSTFLIGGLVRELQETLKQLHATALKLDRSEQHYRSLLEDQTDIFCRCKADGTIIYVNDAYCRLFGKTREELTGTDWHPAAWHEDLPIIEEKLKTLSPAHPAVTIENRVVTRDGRLTWRQFVNRAFFDEAGNILEIQSAGRDIDERKRLDQELLAATEEIRDLYDLAPCSYHSLDANGVFVKVNRTLLEWLGCTREELIGKKSPSDFYTPEGKDLFRQYFPKLKEEGRIEDLEFDLRCRNGRIRRVSLSATSVKDADGRFLMSRTVMHDITVRKVAELRIEHLATHDPLTELPNRGLFYDRLSQALSRARRRSGQLAVLLLDLDDFKPINDRYGHETGDRALKLVARRMVACVRNMDTVARLGGDEFGIILEDIGSPADIELVAEKIIATVSAPLQPGDGVEVQIGVSIGIAVFPQNGEEIGRFMHGADRAMYESKSRGKNAYAFSRLRAGGETPAALAV